MENKDSIFIQSLKNIEDERIIKARKMATSYEKNMEYRKRINHVIFNFIENNNSVNYYKIEKNQENLKVKIWGKNAKYEIVDMGNKVQDNSSGEVNDNLRVKLMIDVCESKGWKLEEMRCHSDNPSFHRAFETEINRRIEKREIENQRYKEQRKAEKKPQVPISELEKNVSVDVNEKPNYSYSMRI